MAQVGLNSTQVAPKLVPSWPQVVVAVSGLKPQPDWVSRAQVGDTQKSLFRQPKKRKSYRTATCDSHSKKKEPPMTNPHSARFTTLRQQLEAYLDTQAAQGKSPRTRESYRERLLPFVDWCEQRTVCYPAQVTLALLESWQRYLRAYCKADGHRYSNNGQRERLSTLRLWFRWL
ncbi:site-specific integrase, partial [Xenorhabdus sp. IM139775]|uniref:site-specific integrase n=1 Tax=Xenorhabdus sp. IM139775 TaxID=3025876 RepID=UPI0023591CDF